jgi:hypothetical protein
MAADTGLVGGALLLGLLWWALVWVARPGGGPGTVVAGFVIAGSVAHACFAPIWHDPAVPLGLAALAGSASTPGGGDASRLPQLWERQPRGDGAPPASEDRERTAPGEPPRARDHDGDAGRGPSRRGS